MRHPLFGAVLLVSMTAPSARASSLAAEDALAAYLPSGDATLRVMRVEGPTFYTSDNLYEYIDGAAEGFIAYNFQRLATATYKYGDQPTQRIVVDLYRMRSAIDGFGVYSSERSPELKFLKLGAEGYIVGNLCIFWKDRHYVKLAARTRTPEAQDVMLRLARGLAKRLPGRAVPPRFLKAFPKSGLIPKSEKYLAHNLLGHAFMPSGFTADYTFGEERAQLFVAVAEEAAGARDAHARLHEFFREFGEVSAEPVELGDRAFYGKEPFYGRSIVVRQGRILAGMLGAPEGGGGERLVRHLLEKTTAHLRWWP